MTNTDTEAAFNAGRDQTKLVLSAPHVDFVAHPAGEGAVEIEAIDTEQYQPAPRRARGHVTIRDVDGFTAYVNRHKGEGTVIFADSNGGMRAVFNHHAPNEVAGWRDHLALLNRPHTLAWLAWMRARQQPLGQAEFANFLEERLGEIVDPDAAGLLEAAEEFRAHKTLRFRSQTKLSNGQRQLEYVETVEGDSDVSGKLTLPERLLVRLQPFRDCEPFDVPVRLRWSLNDAAVKFTLLFDDALKDALEAIYDQAIDLVATQTGALVLRGTDG